MSTYSSFLDNRKNSSGRNTPSAGKNSKIRGRVATLFLKIQKGDLMRDEKKNGGRILDKQIRDPRTSDRLEGYTLFYSSLYTRGRTSRGRTRADKQHARDANRLS
ncbi:hypothetical protein EVAR_36734_1 [Eumeta japonica]|uniref:Uncharacterized protein n=1 Tax=Eumeta variegata TaxID=151549 RepID=A0A4C1X444_EUMVA|nr:hypothetical protein EVAR_36734_1 [Eumeta japonica]